MDERILVWLGRAAHYLRFDRRWGDELSHHLGKLRLPRAGNAGQEHKRLRSQAEQVVGY